jgi:quinol-cytochrome oxidoreductase complex cytochrome b subunit
MTNRKTELRSEEKYAPPYPQEFYAFWPKHAVRSGIMVAILFSIIFLLAWFVQVPTDPNMPPLPTAGEYIPAPEWYLFFAFQPFWYLTGDNERWLSIGTFWLPALYFTFLFLVPYLLGRRKASTVRLVTKKKILWALPVALFWIACLAGVTGSGYPAKTTGCPSCHNPMMGVRQALPPAEMGEYYKVERERQISIGRYRVGETTGDVGSYKDANWQLRHFYEPTMTW